MNFKNGPQSPQKRENNIWISKIAHKAHKTAGQTTCQWISKISPQSPQIKKGKTFKAGKTAYKPMVKLSARSFERIASFLCLLPLLYVRGETAENIQGFFGCLLTRAQVRNVEWNGLMVSALDVGSSGSDSSHDGGPYVTRHWSQTHSFLTRQNYIRGEAARWKPEPIKF